MQNNMDFIKALTNGHESNQQARPRVHAYDLNHFLNVKFQRVFVLLKSSYSTQQLKAYGDVIFHKSHWKRMFM